MKFLEEYGYYAVHYSLPEAEAKTLPELKQRLLNEPIKHTGWPPFWFPTREEIAPKAIDSDTYECVHDGSGRTRHNERWRVSTKGEFTIIRAHDLDIDYPGRYISLTLPVWRVGEIVLHSGRMGEFFRSETVNFTAQFTRLRGRELSTLKVPGRILSDGYRCHAEEYRRSLTMCVMDIDRQVALYTEKLLAPFYHLFEFQLPPTFCEEEIQRMRNSRF